MRDDKKDIFSENELDDTQLVEKDTNNFEIENDELPKRSRKNKKIKKPKKELSPEEIREKEVLKKKQKKNRRLLALAMITVSIITGTLSYKFLNDKIGATEANKEVLYSKFKEAFVDEEHTEIVNNLSGKKVDEIDSLYAKIPDSKAKTQFTQWKQILDEQFNNQENAKTNIKNLYEGSENYISSTVTDAEMTEAENSIKRKFNHEFQNELLKEFEELKSQYNLMKDSINAVNKLYTKDKLNELTQAQLDNIKASIEKNPNKQLKEKQLTKFESAVKEWEERNQKREEEQQRLEEEQRKAEEERQQKELEEARKQAEYEARLEAEREAARQEAYRKEQEELAKKQQEQAQKEQAQKEQEQKDKENQQNQQNYIENNSTTVNNN